MRFLMIVALFWVGALSAQASECQGRLVNSDLLMKSPLCLPKKLERIVILDPAVSLGAALDFDMPVVGAPLFGMNDKPLLARANEKGITDIGQFTAPSLEKIIALKPDLILGSAYLGDAVFNMASQIAPTAFLTTYEWKTYTREIARIADKEVEAEAAFAAYDKRVAALKVKMPDRIVSFLRITNWDFQVYLDGPATYGPFTVLQEVGVKRTPYETTKSDESMKRPDWEELGNLDGELLLYIIGGSNDSDTSGRYEEVLGNPLWKMLPAVAANNVHRIDAGTYIEFSGLAAAHRVLDDVEHYIINAK